MNPDVSSWTRIGSTANAEFFEVAPRILAVVPAEGCTDDEATARASVSLQLEYLRGRRESGGVLIFMDRIADQNAAARTVYRDLPDPDVQLCFALVGDTAFGRAVGSIFLGIRPPRVPTRLFATAEEGLSWIRSVVART